MINKMAKNSQKNLELSINFVFLQKRDFQHKKFTIMKKYLLILIIAIFCLPNIANAQDLSLDAQKEAERQRLMMHRNSDGGRGAYSAYIAAAKIRQRKVEQQKAYLNAKLSAETVTDEATGTTTIKWGDGAMYRVRLTTVRLRVLEQWSIPTRASTLARGSATCPMAMARSKHPKALLLRLILRMVSPTAKA